MRVYEEKDSEECEEEEGGSSVGAVRRVVLVFEAEQPMNGRIWRENDLIFGSPVYVRMEWKNNGEK